MEQKTAIERIGAATNLSPEEVAVIKATVAKGATDTELSYFLMTAKGLDLNPFNKEIWCYKDGKGNVVVFAGRDGFLKIAQRSKRWNGITSSEVRANDQFSIDFANGKITHQISLKERGDIMGAYAIVKPKGCDLATIEWVEMKTYDKGYSVWKSHPAAMIKKVAETNVLKKGFGISGLQSEFDFEVHNDKVYAIDHEDSPSHIDVSYLESLIRSCAYDDDMKASYTKRLDGITWSEFEAMKTDLTANQLDPIDAGMAYSATDIQRKLNQIQ